MDILDLMREQDGDDLAHCTDSFENGEFDMPATKKNAVRQPVYLVKYQMNGKATGYRTYDKTDADETVAALKRNGYKNVHLVTKTVTRVLP